MSNTRVFPLYQAFSDAGVPLSGAKLYFYESGTTTPKNTYSDNGLTTPNANPVVADSAGRFADIFLTSGAYKVVLTTSSGTTIKTLDPVEAEVITTSAFMESLLDDTSASAALTTLGVSSFMQGVLDDTSAATAQASLGLSGLPAWRNILLNGSFRIHQRQSASATSNGAFVVDRWLVGANGGSRTVTRIALDDATRTAIGREDAEYGIEYAATGGTGSGDYEFLTQRIESVRTLAGQTATVSFWAKRTVGTGNMAVELLQSFGSGGSPSAGVTTNGTAITLTSSWARYTVSFTVPSISGKTLGSNGDDSLNMTLWFSGGSSIADRAGSIGTQTITVQIADVAIEPGSVANSFVARPLAVEYALCQRFYETSNPGGAFVGFTANDAAAFAASHPSANFRARVPFRVTKRVAPTVTIYDAAGTAARVSYYNAGWNNGGTLDLGINAKTSGFFLGHVTASSTETQFTWSASAEI